MNDDISNMIKEELDSLMGNDQTDLLEDEELKISSDIINFGMPKKEDIVADSQKVYKKAKKLVNYNLADLPSGPDNKSHSEPLSAILDSKNKGSS